MLTNVFIIRKDMNKFFAMDPDTGNWNWTTTLEDATIFQKADQAETIKAQKNLDMDTYIYEIPYSITQPQARKKKATKRKPVKRIIKKSKSKKR
jgi:hypothetical protein